MLEEAHGNWFCPVQIKKKMFRSNLGQFRSIKKETNVAKGDIMLADVFSSTWDLAEWCAPLLVVQCTTYFHLAYNGPNVLFYTHDCTLDKSSITYSVSIPTQLKDQRKNNQDLQSKDLDRSLIWMSCSVSRWSRKWVVTSWPVTSRMLSSCPCCTCLKIWSRTRSSDQQLWSSFIWSPTSRKNTQTQSWMRKNTNTWS